MLSIPWYICVFVSIPEAVLIVLVGFKSFNLDIKPQQLFTACVISGVSSYLLRRAHVIFGLHTIVALLILIFVCWIITKIEFWKLVISITFGVTISGVLQSITVPILFKVLSLTMTQIISNPKLNLILFGPEGVILTIIVMTISKFNLYIYDLNWDKQYEL
jgi:hypothetical protein